MNNKLIKITCNGYPICLIHPADWYPLRFCTQRLYGFPQASVGGVHVVIDDSEIKELFIGTLDLLRLFQRRSEVAFLWEKKYYASQLDVVSPHKGSFTPALALLSFDAYLR